MSSGLTKIAQNSKKTFAAVEGNIKTAQSSVKYMSASLGEMRARLEAVNRVKVGTVLKSEFREASAEARVLERNIARLEGRGRSMGNSFMRHVTPYLGAAALVMGGIGFAKSSIANAMEFQKQKMTYRTLTGSNSRGDQLSEELRGLKQNTIMGAAVYKNAQTMLGFGIKTDDVVPSLKMLGDVSMGDANRLQHLTLAFSEVAAGGKATGKEIRQFINSGFNPLSEISRTTGKSMAELKEEMHKGGISAYMISHAFETATSQGGRFYKMMDKVGETVVGRMKKLEGQWINLKIQAGEAMMPIVSGLVTWATKLLSVLHVNEKVSDNLRGQRAEITGLVGAITSLNEGNATRKDMLQELLDKYPEFFKGLDAETAKNIDLANAVAKVNGEYDKRINRAGNNELHEEYQKYYRGAAKRVEFFSVMQSLVKQGKYDEAKIVQSRMMPGNIPEYQLNANYKAQVLARLQKSIASSGGEASKYKTLDNNVLGANAGAFISDELMPFYNQQKKKGTVLNTAKKMAEFEAEMKAMYSGIGLQNGRAANARLAAYDFGKIKSMMAGNIIGKNAGTGEEAGGNAGKEVAQGITGGGPRVINIRGVNMKLTENMNVNTTDAKEFLKQLEPEMESFWLRVLHSGAAVQ